MHYLVSLLGMDWDWRKNGIILKTNEIEYFKPVFLGEKPFLKVYLEYIGTKSFTLIYELTVNGEVKTTGKSVLVSFDFSENKTKELDGKFRLALQRLEIK
jgi:acyl-CoA thioester hydrolase